MRKKSVKKETKEMEREWRFKANDTQHVYLDKRLSHSSNSLFGVCIRHGQALLHAIQMVAIL